MFKENTPDFSFVVIENSSNKPNFRSFSYQGKGRFPQPTPAPAAIAAIHNDP